MCRWSPRDDLEYQADDKGKKKGVDTYELRVANGRPSTVRPIQLEILPSYKTIRYI